jgi:hypothetical protein
MSITPRINPGVLPSSPFTPASNQARCTTTYSDNENNHADRRGERRRDRINDNDSIPFKAHDPWQTRVPASSASASAYPTVLGELSFTRTDQSSLVARTRSEMMPPPAPNSTTPTSHLSTNPVTDNACTSGCRQLACIILISMVGTHMSHAFVSTLRTHDVSSLIADHRLLHPDNCAGYWLSN